MTDAKRDLTEFDERYATLSGGSRIRYLVGGSGPPLALVHGLGGTSANWLLVAPSLAEERRVIVPDLPGHGGSEPLEGAATLDPFVDAVLEVLAAEDAVPAPWIGHSLGGTIALHAAAGRPDTVSAIVLAGAAGISSGTRLAEAAVTVLGIVQPGRLAGRFAERLAASATGRRLTFFWGVADPAALDPAMARAFLEGPPQHSDTLTAGRALVASDPRTDLDRVSCPCLCLWGTEDDWVPVADGLEYARRLRAPIRLIADCGHLLIGERPDVVVRAVREFLGSVASG